MCWDRTDATMDSNGKQKQEEVISSSSSGDKTVFAVSKTALTARGLVVPFCVPLVVQPDCPAGHALFWRHDKDGKRKDYWIDIGNPEGARFYYDWVRVLPYHSAESTYNRAKEAAVEYAINHNSGEELRRILRKINLDFDDVPGSPPKRVPAGEDPAIMEIGKSTPFEVLAINDVAPNVSAPSPSDEETTDSSSSRGRSRRRGKKKTSDKENKGRKNERLIHESLKSSSASDAAGDEVRRKQQEAKRLSEEARVEILKYAAKGPDNYNRDIALMLSDFVQPDPETGAVYPARVFSSHTDVRALIDDMRAKGLAVEIAFDADILIGMHTADRFDRFTYWIGPLPLSAKANASEVGYVFDREFTSATWDLYAAHFHAFKDAGREFILASAFDEPNNMHLEFQPRFESVELEPVSVAFLLADEPKKKKVVVDRELVCALRTTQVYSEPGAYSLLVNWERHSLYGSFSRRFPDVLNNSVLYHLQSAPARFHDRGMYGDLGPTYDDSAYRDGTGLRIFGKAASYDMMGRCLKRWAKQAKSAIEQMWADFNAQEVPKVLEEDDDGKIHMRNLDPDDPPSSGGAANGDPGPESSAPTQREPPPVPPRSFADVLVSAANNVQEACSATMDSVADAPHVLSGVGLIRRPVDEVKPSYDALKTMTVTAPLRLAEWLEQETASFRWEMFRPCGPQPVMLDTVFFRLCNLTHARLYDFGYRPISFGEPPTVPGADEFFAVDRPDLAKTLAREPLWMLDSVSSGGPLAQGVPYTQYVAPYMPAIMIPTAASWTFYSIQEPGWRRDYRSQVFTPWEVKARELMRELGLDDGTNDRISVTIKGDLRPFRTPVSVVFYAVWIRPALCFGQDSTLVIQLTRYAKEVKTFTSTSYAEDAATFREPLIDARRPALTLEEYGPYLENMPSRSRQRHMNWFKTKGKGDYDVQVHCNGHTKADEKIGEAKGRAIINSPEDLFYRLVFALVALKEAFKREMFWPMRDVEGLTMWFTYGADLTATGKSEWFSHIMRSSGDGIWVLVGGDDSLLVIRKSGLIWVFEGDVSMCDQSHNNHIVDVNCKALERAGVEDSAIEVFRASYRQPLKIKRKTVSGDICQWNIGFKKSQLHTGAPQTSVANTITVRDVLATFAVSIVGFLDGSHTPVYLAQLLKEYAETVGMVWKVTVHNEMRYATFHKGFWIPVKDHWQWIPLPSHVWKATCLRVDTRVPLPLIIDRMLFTMYNFLRNHLTHAARRVLYGLFKEMAVKQGWTHGVDFREIMRLRQPTYLDRLEKRKRDINAFEDLALPLYHHEEWDPADEKEFFDYRYHMCPVDWTIDMPWGTVIHDPFWRLAVERDYLSDADADFQEKAASLI